MRTGRYLIVLTTLLCSLTAQARPRIWFPLEHYQPTNCGWHCYRAPTTGRWHEAYDYAVPNGTPLYAPVNGIVVQVVDGMGNTYPHSFVYGNYVRLNFDGNYQIILAHLEENSIRVRVGDRVKVGDIIARTNDSGYSSGPHVHVEVQRNATYHGGGDRVDPRAERLWVMRGNEVVPALESAIARGVEKVTDKAYRKIKGIWPPDIDFGPGPKPLMRIINSSIRHKAKGVDCVPSIKLKFSEPVELEAVRNAFSLRHELILPYLLVNYINNHRQVEITGFFLTAHKQYSIALKGLESKKGNLLADWQISFTTGDWPHPPLPATEEIDLIEYDQYFMFGDGKADPGSHVDKWFSFPRDKIFAPWDEIIDVGLSWSATFRLLAKPQKIIALIGGRGYEYLDPVTVNGHLLTCLTSHPESSPAETYLITSNMVKAGQNQITIESNKVHGNSDDFYISCLFLLVVYHD